MNAIALVCVRTESASTSKKELCPVRQGKRSGDNKDWTINLSRRTREKELPRRKSPPGAEVYLA